MSDFLSAQTRTETDSIGSLEIPAAAYWGVHTARAHENFPIARRPISVYPDFVRAFACVKQAAARANLEIGALDEQRSSARQAKESIVKEAEALATAETQRQEWLNALPAAMEATPASGGNSV